MHLPFEIFVYITIQVTSDSEFKSLILIYRFFFF